MQHSNIHYIDLLDEATSLHIIKSGRITIYYYFLICLEKMLKYSINQNASIINVHLNISNKKESISINDNSYGVRLINLKLFIKKNLLNLILSNCKIHLFTRNIMEILGLNLIFIKKKIIIEKAFKSCIGTYLQIEATTDNKEILKDRLIHCKNCYLNNIYHIGINKNIGASIKITRYICKNKSFFLKKQKNIIKPCNLLMRIDIKKYYFLLIYYKAKHKNIMFCCTLEYNKQSLIF